MIALTSISSTYTAAKKEDRKKIYQHLATELPKAGSKLVPVPLEIFSEVQHFGWKIYKVSNMDKVPFGKKILEICPNTQFFASYMGGSEVNRVRKFALMTFENGDQYIVFQQSVEYSNVLSILDLKNKKRTKIKSLDKLTIYFKIIRASIQDLPLLINNPWVEKYPEFRKELNKRLQNI
jgi:hypothetical protein